MEHVRWNGYDVMQFLDGTLNEMPVPYETPRIDAERFNEMFFTSFIMILLNVFLRIALAKKI